MDLGNHPYRRIVTFLAGLFFLSLGVMFSTKAVLGTSPIQSIPFVLNLGTGYSIGVTTMFVNTIFLILGVLIMGRLYKLKYLTQIITVVIFSTLCDVFAHLFSGIVIDTYVMQWLSILLSSITLSLGIALELAANVSVMPAEYLVSFVAFRTKMEFGKVKVMFDIINILIAGSLSLMFFGCLQGVREGTIFAACTTGFIVRFYTRHLKRYGFYEFIGNTNADSGRL